MNKYKIYTFEETFQLFLNELRKTHSVISLLSEGYAVRELYEKNMTSRARELLKYLEFPYPNPTSCLMVQLVNDEMAQDTYVIYKTRFVPRLDMPEDKFLILNSGNGILLSGDESISDMPQKEAEIYLSLKYGIDINAEFWKED